MRHTLFPLSIIRPLILLLVACGAGAVAAQQGTLLRESTRALYRGEHELAARLAGEHLRKYPRDASARVVLARAELAQGKFQRAFEELNTALAADPRHIDAHYYLAIVARVLSQQEYQRLFALAPDSDRVHLLMAEAALAQEDQVRAETEFMAALRANPRSVEALVGLAELKRAQSRFDEAISYYTQAEQAGPLGYDVAYGLGASYTYKQQHARAIEYLRRAVALAPDEAAGRFALGNALFQSGQLAAALPELKATLALEPGFKQAYFLLGRAHQRLGQPAEAKAAFDKLAELNRSAPATEPATAPAPDAPPKRTSPARATRQLHKRRRP